MQMKFCLACNKELIGRTDKKFCDAQCRSTYHNKNRPIHEITIQRTNSSLRKNRTLLAHFSPSGKTTVKKEILLKSGYRFDVFTHMFTFKTGTYYFCYDYGYLPVKDDKGVEKMLIVQKQDYMDNLKFDPWASVS
jgi:hypothetical protein